MRGNTTLTVYQESTPDRWGDRTVSSQGRQVPGCTAYPVQATEPGETDGRSTKVTTLAVLAPHDSGIRADDEVAVSGYTGRWKVVGDPGRWDSPFTGWKPGVELRVEKVRG